MTLDVGAFTSALGVSKLLNAGTWAASTGSFPAQSIAGTYYVVINDGTVDGQEFTEGQWLVPLVTGASTSTFAGNWGIEAGPLNGSAAGKLGGLLCACTGDGNYALTYGGLTPTTGMQVRFIPGNTNGIAPTLNLDGTGAVACRTVTGEVPPSGYIFATGAMEHTATFDGTYWVVSRPPLVGAGTNGLYVQLENGLQACWHAFNTSATERTTWTFESPFIDGNYHVFSGARQGDTAVMVSYEVPLASSLAFNGFNASGARVVTTVNAFALGYWY